MTMPTNADTAGAAASSEPRPLALHDLYRQQAACGYTRDLTLCRRTVQQITARLRGISAITAVLTASSDDESLHLGDWLRFGLIEAIDALASDAHHEIERINERARKEGGAA